jgi:hypothetical protein
MIREQIAATISETPAPRLGPSPFDRSFHTISRWYLRTK